MQQKAHCQQKRGWKQEFLRFLSVFQECEEQELDIKQIKLETGQNLVPLQHQH